MMKVRNVSLLVVAAAVVLFAGSVAPAVVMQKGHPGSAGTPHFPATDTPLYTQLDGASGQGAPDQAFEAAYTAYSSEGADDFIVGGAWEVGGLNTPGSTTGGASIHVNVTFYLDNGGGLPLDTPECEILGITTYTDTAGDLSIDFSDTKCVLSAGQHVWVAQEVRQDFTTSGQHFWSNRAVLSNSQSVWRNPADGFGTTCTDWDQQTDCGVGGGVSPDFLFEITESKAGGTVVGTPAVGPFGMLMTVLALGGGSAYVLARRRRA